MGSRDSPSKLLVIGLDSVPPSLAFDRWRSSLPNLNRLMSGGAYGSLRSCIPCITVPAWSVMTTGKDPGTLGIYGFRNRADYSYDRMRIATAASVKEPRVWDLLGQAGKRVVTIGVPGTYPPRPVNGAQIGCMLTPQTVIVDEKGKRTSRVFTYPPDLSDKANAWAGGEYLVDVKQFRTENKDSLLQQIYAMSRQHFRVIHEMLTREPWDFFMFVEMGPDRLHHGFWRFFDSSHSRYEPGNALEESASQYYEFLDDELGQILDRLDEDTAIMVVSDHGAKAMVGGICINEWLLNEGWLVLKAPYPDRVTPLEKVEIDWEKTAAWGEGGYYGRVFLNVEGREPQGTVPRAEYESVRNRLAQGLGSIGGPANEKLETRVFAPEGIYREVNGIPPDLLVYFGDLQWRSVASLGHQSVWAAQNDTGPDDSNHAEDGIFIFWDPANDLEGQMLQGLEIMDFAPTVLRFFGVEIPDGVQGRTMPIPGLEG